MYLDYFVGEHKCSFDIIKWIKTNAMPLFSNKYLSDTEYCLYFKKNGYCRPKNYEMAKTYFFEKINIKDKRKYGHPTIKPLDMISRFILNSSKPNDIILDPFMGSGTTAVACLNYDRRFIGFEISEKYYQIAIRRINEAYHNKKNKLF